MALRSDRDHGRTQGEVGDEVAVHHVDVDDARPAALGRCDLVRQAAEVGGQDRRGEDHWAGLADVEADRGLRVHAVPGGGDLAQDDARRPRPG